MTKYPKRNNDCEYTEDCLWGEDGLCDRPPRSKCVIAEAEENYKKENNERKDAK